MPSALGVRVAGIRDLERLTGLGAAGAEAAGDLSMLPPLTVRAEGVVPALARGLPRSAWSKSAADGGG